MIFTLIPQLLFATLQINPIQQCVNLMLAKRKQLDCALPKFIIFALPSRKYLLPLNDLLSFQPQTTCIFATCLRVIPACLNVITYATRFTAYADSQRTSALKHVVGLHWVVSESMSCLSISRVTCLLAAPDIYNFWSWILGVLWINTVEWALHRRVGGRFTFRLVPKSRTW
jgi:hypothetical protein